MNSFLHKFLISRKFWAINSVGLECYLDRVDVTGSSPVWPTKKKPTQMSGFSLSIAFSNPTINRLNYRL